jgi:hypothetical protein
MIEINGEKYYTAKELAEKFGVTIDTISDWKNTNKLKAYEMSERKYICSETEVERFIKEDYKPNSTKKLTNFIVDQRLLALGGKIKRIGDYKGNKTSLLFECQNPECMNKWPSTTGSVLNKKSGCPDCALKNKKKKYTNDTFDELIKDKSLIRIDDYKGIEFSINFKCKKCSGITFIPPNHMMYDDCNHCEHCNMSKLTNEDVDKRLEGRDIERLEDYTDMHTNMWWGCKRPDCKKIGYKWEAEPMGLLNAPFYGCPKCGGQEGYADEVIDRKIKEQNRIHPITRIGQKLPDIENVEFRCDTCLKHWFPRIRDVLNNESGCPDCAIKARSMTNEEVDAKLIEMGNEIKRIGEYKNMDMPVEWLCLNPSCNNTWVVIAEGVLIKGTGCPLCAVGKSERKLGKLIKEYVKYDYYKHHKRLYFNDRYYWPDYYLEINGQKIIIERQGEQHYEPLRWRKTMSQKQAEINFFHQIIRDNEMRWYCDDNNIKLVEIPYWLEENEIIEELKDLNYL